MESNGGDHKTITHDFPVWREKANFILAVRLNDPDVPKEWEWEQIWARQVEENVFEICCVPFFAYGLALGDFVNTATVEGKKYSINEILEKNGHTTYRIWFRDLDKWNSVIENIKDLDCLVEIRWEKSKLIAVDAPTSEVRNTLESYLTELEAVGIIRFEAGF